MQRLTRCSLRMVAMAALVAGTAACGGHSGGTSKPATSTSRPSPATGAQPGAASLPAGFHPVSGMAYQFALPDSPAFTLDSQTVGAGGSLELRWRHAVTAAGPFCLVLAIEQKNYTGQFPAAPLQLFASNSQPDQHTLRNEVMKPAPAGAVGAIDQESTFTATLDDGTSVPSHFYQRVYLTPGHSLIQLVVAGPESQATTCRFTDILATFALTGREFTGATATAAPSASLSPTPTENGSL